LGYVPQQLAFYADMGSLALLDYFARLRRAPAGDPERLLARVGLADQARKPVGALSGGMKQRLALALALLGDPPILILDEPTASLDADARADFLSLLVEQRVAGKTLILTSHRLEEVAMLADRVIVLADGRPQFECPSHALERALHPESTLKVALDDPRIEAALAALAEAGFEARRNGHGLRVRVATGRRALPLATLLAAGIPVDDLSLEERTWSPE
jgi:ABC-type multidrug transport system ATPase subunit